MRCGLCSADARRYSQLTHEVDDASALADGYSGVRLVADATVQARAADARASWVRTEHEIDRFALDHPLTVLCGYDVDRLGAAPVAEVACVHGLTRDEPSPFLLHAADTDGALALSGEVDVLSARDLQRALVRIGPPARRRVVLDLAELEFIDHADLLAVERAARALEVTVALVRPSRMASWLVTTLGLEHVTLPTVGGGQ